MTGSRKRFRLKELVMEPDTTSPAKEVEDRLSSLPTHIMHIILSLLSMEDIAKLSLTSKKCEKLCLSVPSLNINADELSFYENSAKRTQFLDFLVNFMKHHRGANLRNLHIWWFAEYLKYNEIIRFMWLLNHAVECDVHELNLNLCLGDGVVFVMPLDVFCCESLRSLSINFHYGALEFPSPHGFAHLRSLKVSDLTIDDDSFGEIISSVCKFLEKLSLRGLIGIGKFKISSTSLLELTIKYCSLEHLDISARLLQTLRLNSAPSMNVYAPNLLCLHWKGFISEYCFVENLSLLQNVHLSMRHDNFRRIKLNSLLPNIVQISRLHINSITIMALYEDGCLPFIFSNLQTLELNDEKYFEGDLLASLPYSLESLPYSLESLPQATTSILQGLPCNLKKLHIGISSFNRMQSFTYEANYWESQNLRFVQGLEEMNIIMYGGKYEEGFLEYVLDNAIELKKMSISFRFSMPATIVCKLMAVAVARGACFCFEELKMGDAGFCFKEQKKMVLQLD